MEVCTLELKGYKAFSCEWLLRVDSEDSDQTARRAC